MNIIVTGASKGLGKALAIGFSEKGHRVGLIARSQKLLQTICWQLHAKGKGRSFFTSCDLTNTKASQLALEKLITEMDGVDVLINNAGQVVRKGLLDISADEWNTALATNVTAAFNCTQTFVPHFLKQGNGHIINISSLSTKIALERGIAYGAGKHALNGFSNSLIHELHAHGIKVCTIHPGAFTVAEDNSANWKMPASEILRACEFVLNSHPKAFVEEMIVRPLNWPE